MLLHICTCFVLLSVAKSAQVKHLEPVNEKPNDAPKPADAIFADVIKNISRVNNVLQELINNYEHLQKIYKSQENVESVYSDSEIDEIFKSKNDNKPNRAKDVVSNRKPISEKFAATQMYWSDHDEDNDNSNTDTEEAQNDDIKNKDYTIKHKKDVPATLKTTTLKPETSEEASDESSHTSLSQEKINKHKVVQKPARINILNIPRPKKPQAEVIFVDTHRKPKEIPTKIKKEVKSKPKIKPSMQFVSVSTKPKTRFSKISHNEAKPKLPPQDFILKTGMNNTKKVKKIMHSESFSPKKIWHEIINNKPIQLEAHNEVILRRLDTVKHVKQNQTFDKRTQNDKSALVILKKNKNKNNASTSSEDELTHKEELNTNVLREAYGDACLKLVLRKCFKACKKVTRAACNRVKCKSSVRDSFKSFARTGCIKEFEGGPEAHDTEKVPAVPPSANYRGQKKSFADMTRGGFLSAACLPHATDHKAISLRNDTPTNAVENFNILRDRFERACKKVSYGKCKNACRYAYTQMCEIHVCSKRMKKMFKKQCRTQCKNAYEVSRSSEESSDSYSSDGSDEESTSTDSNEDTD